MPENDKENDKGSDFHGTKLYGLPGIRGTVAPPRRWPEGAKEGETQDEGSYSEMFTVQGRQLFGTVQDLISASADLAHGVAVGAVQSVGYGSDADSNTSLGEGRSVADQIQNHGRVCPYINSSSNTTVKYLVDDKFLTNPTGSFTVPVSSGVGRGVFDLFVKSHDVVRLSDSEDERHETVRQISCCWFGYDPEQGHAPLAMLRNLQAGRSPKEAEAIRVGGKWGIWDVSDRLVALVDQPKDQRAKSWVIRRIVKNSSGAMTTEKMGEVDPIPELPMNPGALKNVYVYDAEHKAIAVVRATGKGRGDGNAKDKLAVEVYQKGDIPFALLCLFSSMICQDISKEDIEEFNAQVGAGADDGFACCAPTQ